MGNCSVGKLVDKKVAEKVYEPDELMVGELALSMESLPVAA